MKPALLCLIVSLPGIAQEQSPPKFRGEAPLVILPVAVYDKSGKLVDNIDANDFMVFDNGQPRPVHVDLIGTFRTKMALVIVIQTSGISQAALLKIDRVGSLIEGYITGEGAETAASLRPGIKSRMHSRLLSHPKALAKLTSWTAYKKPSPCWLSSLPKTGASS